MFPAAVAGKDGLPGFREYWEYWECAGKEKGLRKAFSSRSQAKKNTVLSELSVIPVLTAPLIIFGGSLILTDKPETLVCPGSGNTGNTGNTGRKRAKKRVCARAFLRAPRREKKCSALRTLSNPSAPSSPDNPWRGCLSHRLCRKPQRGWVLSPRWG